MRFSKRTSWATNSNLLAAKLAQKRRAGHAIIDLTESNPTRCSFRYLKPNLLKPFLYKRNLRYEPDPKGLLKTREAVARYYSDKKVKINPEDIFITAGTSEAYSFLFHLLADAGEAIASPRPSYPLFDYLADMNDVKLVRYPLVYQDGWQIAKNSLEKCFKNKPKALIVLNPNNPTGNFVSANERVFINELCAKKNAAIISDEVFLDFAWNGPPPRTFADNKQVLTFTLSGISKILGLPQMKLSWIVVSGPEPLKKKAIERLEIIADTYLSANTPSQHALPVWFKNREKTLREILDRLLTNRTYLEKAFEDIGGVQLMQSQGGWYSTIRCRSGLSDEELAIFFLEHHNILIYPGFFFDFPQEGHFVLSQLVPEEDYKMGINCLYKGLIKLGL